MASIVQRSLLEKLAQNNGFDVPAEATDAWLAFTSTQGSPAGLPQLTPDLKLRRLENGHGAALAWHRANWYRQGAEVL